MKFRILEGVSLASGHSFAPGEVTEDLPEEYHSAPWAEPLAEKPAKKAAPKAKAAERATEPPVETATA